VGGMSPPGTLAEFKASLAAASPPADLPPALEALWRAGKGDWEGAHRIAQETKTPDGDWIHAYLHRVEGDLSNARYWYAKAGRPAAAGPLEAEWDEIASALLEA